VLLGLVLLVNGESFFRPRGSAERAHLLVSNDVEVVLIGETALEILVLKVDPVTGKLVEGKVYLLRGWIAGDPLLLLWGFLFLCEYCSQFFYEFEGLLSVCFEVEWG